MTAEILLVCEMSIALISSCLPSIFNFAKHAARKPLSYMSRKSARSNNSRNAVDLNMGTIRSSVGERRKNGFPQMQIGEHGLGDSDERFFVHTDRDNP